MLGRLNACIDQLREPRQTRTFSSRLSHDRLTLAVTDNLSAQRRLAKFVIDKFQHYGPVFLSSTSMNIFAAVERMW